MIAILLKVDSTEHVFFYSEKLDFGHEIRLFLVWPDQKKIVSALNSNHSLFSLD